jgi:hypothetical protein
MPIKIRRGPGKTPTLDQTGKLHLDQYGFYSAGMPIKMSHTSRRNVISYSWCKKNPLLYGEEDFVGKPILNFIFMKFKYPIRYLLLF